MAPTRVRRGVVLCLLAAATIGLLGRALDLQFTHREFLKNQGDARHLRSVRTQAHRGLILDRNGEILAVSTPVDSVWVNPMELAAERKRWPELTRLLALDPEGIHQLLAGRMDREFVYLKRHLEPHVASRVVQLRLSGVYLQREYRRYYPTGEVAAHVVGFTNVDDVGQEGLELAFDEWLQGVDGAKRVLRDRLGRTVEDVENLRAARPGKDLRVSIDRRIQYLAYRALKSAVHRHGAKSGSAVVLDARTGEVLAMVNQPSYNPNNRADRVSSRYRNRAVTDVFEPGSTIKPFTVAAGLESELFRPTTRVDTAPGYFKVGKYTVHDMRNYGVLNVATVLKKSSNVGATKLALSLPPETLWNAMERAGFGRTTGSEFPGESTGILTHFSRWSRIHQATLSFGYGLSVTPLQLAQAYGVIASGGYLRPVTFLPGEGVRKGRRVLSRSTANQTRRMLTSVVSEGGTGRRAHISGYRVAGKTGTVHKSTAGGYAEDRYLAVFAGMAPASAPRLVMVVVIDEPAGSEYYGGQVAAPVFAEVIGGALRLMGIAPDDHSGTVARIALADDGITWIRAPAQAAKPPGRSAP